MLRDLVRTACAITAMAFAASLIVETRASLLALDAAHRQLIATTPVPAVAATPAPPPGRLRTLGRAALDLADAGLGMVR